MIGSVHSRGLSSDSVKRRDIFCRYRDKYDITFLVDTHSTKESKDIWRNEWGYTIMLSSYTQREILL